MGFGCASTPQVVKCPDHTARAEIHAAVTTLSRVIERVSRPKHFTVELAKRIDDNFLDRCCDVAWIPWHQPHRNMPSSFDHENLPLLLVANTQWDVCHPLILPGCAWHLIAHSLVRCWPETGVVGFVRALLKLGQLRTRRSHGRYRRP